MCGIAGIFSYRRHPAEADLETILRMTDTISHRGPDGRGFWCDREAGITLGHRRLAIIDLTDTGHQPMLSSSGRFVIAFNGEIYNFRALREQLRHLGYPFRGTSDTEVLLAAVEHWGFESALQRSNGMFAIALWDRANHVLHLARDRLGKKPLYVARTTSGIVFASELKAIRACPGVDSELSLPAVAALLSKGRIPDEHCIWSTAFKVPAGGLLSLSANDIWKRLDLAAMRRNIRTWWSLAEVALKSRMVPFSAPDSELIHALDELLRAAVRDRMIADVPIGAFLSGGIDSSTVVALMQAQSERPIRTFTIAFDEPRYDESDRAASVARYLGTDHTEERLTPADAFKVIPSLPTIWDEPFADESQIPTFLISRVARQHVTVTLSGDGGDECFAGYNRHVLVARAARLLAANPSLRRSAATLAVQLVDKSYRMLAGFGDAHSRMSQGERLRRLMEFLGARDPQQLYEDVTRISAVRLAQLHDHIPDSEGPELDEPLSHFLFRDMAEYLPSDILVKLDRATMATSLEARCPLLDHRVIEFAWRLPGNTKIRRGQGKWILRQVLARYLPRKLFERPKQGFDVPINTWLQGPLRAWASDLLSERRLRRQGLLDVALVQLCWREHLAGVRDHSRVLWAVLMLQAWLDSVDNSPSTFVGDDVAA